MDPNIVYESMQNMKFLDIVFPEDSEDSDDSGLSPPTYTPAGASGLSPPTYTPQVSKVSTAVV